MSEPDWSESKTGDCEIWKNPLIPMDERLLIADGAIRFRNEQIAKLKEQNALLTVQVQEGWKLVPVEPTADMIIAASDGYETGEVIGPASCYRVMIAAAPALPQQVKSEDDDTALLNAIQENSWDLVSRTLTSGGDCEIGWQVIEHHMAKPYERVIGENFQDDARAAIRAAISAQENKS